MSSNNTSSLPGNNSTVSVLNSAAENSRRNSSDTSIKSKTSLLGKISVAVLISWAASFILFFGYTYLKGLLEGAGFENPTISPSVYELIYYFLLGISDVVIALTKMSGISSVLQLIFICSMAVVVVFISFIALYKYSESSRREDQQEVRIGLFERFLIKCSSSWKSFMISLPLVTVVGGICYSFLTFLMVFVFILPWALAMSGTVTGINDGAETFKKFSCTEIKWAELKEKKLQGCTELLLKDGKVLVGRRLYQHNGIVFFISNEGAYEINSKREVEYFKPYHYAPKIEENDVREMERIKAQE